MYIRTRDSSIDLSHLRAAAAAAAAAAVLVLLLVLRLVCVLPSRCLGRPRQHTEKSSYASLDLSRSAPHSVSLYLSLSAAHGAARAAPLYPPRSRAAARLAREPACAACL